MRRDAPYTTQLQAGLGLVEETKSLLDLWSPGMSATDLHQMALESGRFPTITARRLRNVIAEGFAPRYLVNKGAPARYIQQLARSLAPDDLRQIMFLFTCRANPILGDFIREVYWDRYAGGQSQLTKDDARNFVERGIDDGKTAKRWSESTLRRVSAYLTGCCADFGLLEQGARTNRVIKPFHIAPSTATLLAYDLHFAGVGDNAVLAHEDWQLFGLERDEVLTEMKQMSLRDLVLVQHAGDVVRISWKQKSMEAVCNVLAKG